MFRIFSNSSNIKGDVFYIPEKDKNHLGNVVRLKKGDNFEAVVGNRVYELVYLSYDLAEVVSYAKICQDEHPQINLFFSLLKGDKNELILQKCTELGVTNFYPMNTLRTVMDLSGKEENRIKRWKKIVEAASKQSKSKFIPEVHYPINLTNLSEYISYNDFTIVPYEMESSTTMKDVLRSEYNGSSDINIIIGPEGGFDSREILSLLRLNAYSVSLGTKILRAETAAIVAVANLIYELEIL